MAGLNELANIAKQKLFDAIHTSAAPAISKKRETFVLEAPISDWERSDAIETIVAGLREGDILTLTHETDAEYYNVSVSDKFGQKIGYLKGGNWKIIARLMDAGKQFKAVLSPKEPEYSEHEEQYPELMERRKTESFLNMKIYYVE